MNHATKEALVLPLVVMLRDGLEMVMGWQIEGAIRKTVRDTCRGVMCIVLPFVMVVLVAHEVHNAMEAFDAEAFDLVSSRLCGGLDSGDTAENLRHDAAHDIAALSIRCVGCGSDRLDRVESNLLNAC